MWTDKTNTSSALRLLGFIASIPQRARGRITLRALLQPRMWALLWERLKRELRLYSAHSHPKNRLALTPEQVYTRNRQIRADIVELLCHAASDFTHKPLFSIVMPVYNVAPCWLEAAIISVQQQIYPYWELCIADDASTHSDTLETLARYATDPRIKIHYRKQNGHISAASNSAAALASGEFLVLLDNDDLLAPEALFEIASLLNQNPVADIIYSDEDKIDIEGKHYDLHFKPDWSPTLLLGYNYINHLTCIRRDLFIHIGGFSLGLEGAQDYDLLLRASEHTKHIHHIPKILYHWRAVPESTATAAAVKPMVEISANQALHNHLNRQNIPAQTYRPAFAELYRLPINQLDWPAQGPKVDILIFGGENGQSRAACADSVRRNTRYQNYHSSLIDSSAPTEQEYPLARRLNQAARASQADLVLFLDGDTRIIEPQWLSRLVGYLGLPGVGITGAKLVLAEGRIHHAGFILGGESGYTSTFLHESSQLPGYFFLADTARECAAVSTACLLTRRNTFMDHGGFDERFRVSGFDVDFCLRCADHNLRSIHVPGAVLSYQGNTKPDVDDLALIKQHPRPDSYHNPNFKPSTFAINPSAASDYEKYLGRPLKVLFFTHNLNLEGATQVILNLAVELTRRGHIQALIVSPQPGPGQELLEHAHIPHHILKLKGCDNILSGWANQDNFSASLDHATEFLAQTRSDVVVANVINSFFMIEAAARCAIPCLWIIHESYDRALLVRSIDTFNLITCEQAFAKANNVIFVSEETQNLYADYNIRHNFSVIHNTLSPDFHSRLNITRDEARQHLGLSATQPIILTVGTVCERKDQETLVRALRILADTHNDFHCLIVGARLNHAYTNFIRELITQLNLDSMVSMIPETRQVAEYYAAADLFAFTSLNESYSLTLLEALGFGLPIITTPCVGVGEQVEFGANALRCEFRDHATLAQHLATLLNQPAQRAEMAEYSRKLFQNMASRQDMLAHYERLIFAAWQTGFWQPPL